MRRETCPRGHVYLADVSPRCPRCEVPGPEDLFAPMDFPGPPPRVIDAENRCFHSIGNLSRVSSHFDDLLREIVESDVLVRDKTKRILSFFVWANGYRDQGFFALAGSVEDVLHQLGEESETMLLTAAQIRPELKQVAELTLWRRFSKEPVAIACTSCGRGLDVAASPGPMCPKCKAPFDPARFSKEIWFRCPSCKKMVHESDWKGETKLCACGKRFRERDLEGLRKAARRQRVADALGE